MWIVSKVELFLLNIYSNNIFLENNKTLLYWGGHLHVFQKLEGCVPSVSLGLVPMVTAKLQCNFHRVLVWSLNIVQSSDKVARHGERYSPKEKSRRRHVGDWPPWKERWPPVLFSFSNYQPFISPFSRSFFWNIISLRLRELLRGK